MDKIQDFVGLVIRSFGKDALKKVVFSRPTTGEIKKVTGRLVLHKGRRLLALEYSLPGDTVSHRNIAESELYTTLTELCEKYAQANLITALGEAEWKISKSGKEALLGADKLLRRLEDGAPAFERAIEALDKEKNYILSGGEDFLRALGVSDKGGRVHDKKQGKFRQINRFLEHIEDVYGELPESGEVLIYDLCCGKSYLSFAVYYYLTAIKGREVRLLGIDLKRDVIRWCGELADTLCYSGMSFRCDDVRNTPEGEVPDMVISLHACDVATDIVINRAIELGARVILSTPCCHRYLNDRLAASELEFVSRFPHLRNKLCEAITDSIRLARLEAAGYKVSAPELTDPDDTPKNTLIRAIKRGDRCEAAAQRYEEILSFVLGSARDEYLKGM